MARNPRRIDAELDALYDEVPDIPGCKGLCMASCGPIACSTRERTRVEEAGGRKLEAPGMRCSMLDALGRCGVYDQRPMVCRLWGATEDMACPYGCLPERMLDQAEGFDLLRRSLEAGGDPGYHSLLDVLTK